MLACPNEYGIYKTEDLVSNLNSGDNSSRGSDSGVISPRVNYDGTMITYLKDNKEVMATYLDENDKIVVQKLMEIDGIADHLKINELWVFKNFAAISISSG
jgi:hypothetical protein